uniref:PPPDE domain-containing protein n=1 Tax=Noctiluca scintillans TaxID=2966 RepID=A0A7S1FF42_NOCSC
MAGGIAATPSPKSDGAPQLSAGHEHQRAVPFSLESTVFLHIYHCDPYTAFLNRVVLKDADMPIYHAGVEVFGEEWAFQYFEDTFDDRTVTGVICCAPKKMQNFDYQYSLSLGATPLSVAEVDALILVLQKEWPAASYHISRCNCLTFAETLVKQLQTPEPFPQILKGILDAGERNPRTEAVVDWGWSWLKWWMLRKNAVTDEEEAQGSNSSLQPQSPQGWWHRCVNVDTSSNLADTDDKINVSAQSILKDGLT